MNIIKEITEARQDSRELGLEFNLSDVGSIVYNRIWDIAQNFAIKFGRKRYCHSHYWNKDGFVITNPFNHTKWFVWEYPDGDRGFGTYNSLAERKAKATKERGSK